MKFLTGGANELWPLVGPVIYLSIVTLLLGEAVRESWGTNLANFGQNQMPVGTTLRRYSDHIGVHNTRVAGKILQWLENTELRMCDHLQAEQYA